MKIPGTYNYKLVVECVNPSHILMKPDRAEAICDTDTGILSATKLTACARTIKPSTMLPWKQSYHCVSTIPPTTD